MAKQTKVIRVRSIELDPKSLSPFNIAAALRYAQTEYGHMFKDEAKLLINEMAEIIEREALL